jgi:hypothetical protein
MPGYTVESPWGGRVSRSRRTGCQHLVALKQSRAVPHDLESRPALELPNTSGRRQSAQHGRPRSIQMKCGHHNLKVSTAFAPSSATRRNPAACGSRCSEASSPADLRRSRSVVRLAGLRPPLQSGVPATTSDASAACAGTSTRNREPRRCALPRMIPPRLNEVPADTESQSHALPGPCPPGERKHQSGRSSSAIPIPVSSTSKISTICPSHLGPRINRTTTLPSSVC